MTLEEAFTLVEESNCTWHGLYQGHDGSSNEYGTALWNVRLRLRGEPREGHYACAGGHTLQSAILGALVEAERQRTQRPRIRPELRLVRSEKGDVEMAVAYLNQLSPEELDEFLKGVLKS